MRRWRRLPGCARNESNTHMSHMTLHNMQVAGQAHPRLAAARGPRHRSVAALDVPKLLWLHSSSSNRRNGLPPCISQPTSVARHCALPPGDYREAAHASSTAYSVYRVQYKAHGQRSPPVSASLPAGAAPQAASRPPGWAVPRLQLGRAGLYRPLK